MARDIRTIRAAALEALGSFRFHEFAPFAWILAAELAVLILAMNLGTAWGMASAGWLSSRLTGDRVLHYPIFYAFLPTLMTNVEAVLYAFAGSVLIPLALIRVLRPIDPAAFPAASTGARLKQAFFTVLVAAVLCEALILGWQFVLNQPAVLKAIRAVLRSGFASSIGVTVLGMLVGYALWTLFVYIPVSAVQPGRSFGAAFGGGLREGLANFFPTYLVVIGLSLPAAAILLVLQVMGSFLVTQIRPEIIGVLIGLYAILSMLATFFIYSAAARFHQARQAEAA
jgi:hypothetical protein